MRICYTPIGVVEKGVPKKRGRGFDRYSYESVIRIYEEYVDGLEGLDEYSHIYVIYHLHEEERTLLRLRPWGMETLPTVGIFATRFPSRPNKIGLSIARIVEVSPPYLRLLGLDAWTGTPILDIKPYDLYDVVEDPRVPEWFYHRWRRPEWWGGRG